MFSQQLKLLFTLALPMMVAQVFSLLMTFVDNLMVGRLGPDFLAGLSLASGYYNLASIIAIGILSALAPFASAAFGKKDYEKMTQIGHQGLFIATLMSVVLFIILLFAEPILLLTGQQAHVTAIATEYLHVLMFAVPAQLAFYALRNISDANNDALPASAIAGIAALLNVPLDYALILGKWGFPEYGVVGAAIATTLLSWLGFFVLLIYLHRGKKYKALRLFSRPNFNLASLIEIIRQGIPLGAAIASEMGFFVILTFLIGRIGTTELAAHQVALNATAIAFMIPLGLSFAVGIRISNLLSLDKKEEAHATWKASLLLSFLFSCVSSSFFIFAPDFIIGLYDQTGEVKHLAISLLFVAGFFQLVDGFQVVGVGALRGLHEGKIAFRNTMFSFWVLGAAIVFYSYSQGDVVGIWIAMLVALAIASVFHHYRVWKQLRT